MVYNKSFTIVFDDLSEYINTHDKSLLKEDMLQLAYKEYIIDLGFYLNGFILYLIKDYNWDTPIKKEHIQENEITNKLNKMCDEILSDINLNDNKQQTD